MVISGGDDMEYTVKKLAEIAGISKRTLRYYDDIGLLKPCRINSSGYRIYGENEIDMLQQILFYRSMDMKLEDIHSIITHPDFDITKSLIEHHQKLISKRNQIDQLISTVEKTILNRKGEVPMSVNEKFEGFKKETIKENEEKYGDEIRKKYGEKTIEDSNKKFLNMSEDDYQKMLQVEKEMFESLKEVLKTNDLESGIAKNVFAKHKEWLGFTWTSYSPDAHIGMAKMYVADERFAEYYNSRIEANAVKTLHDIILMYAK